MNVLDTLACEVVSYTSMRPWDAAAAWKINALYFSANGDDPRFETEHELVAAECERLRINFCLWLNVPREATGGMQFAQESSAKVEHYGGAAHVKAVMFDNEKVPLGFQSEYIDEWDRIRPYRPTLYSVEPGQDTTQNDYPRMLRRNDGMKIGTHIYPPGYVRKVTFQCYQGGMQPLDPLTVRTNHYGPQSVPDVYLCPTIDPAQPAAYIASAAACGLRGLMLFESGRIRT